MKAVRRQRLVLVVFIVVVSSVAVGLLTYALRENINLFYTPEKIRAGEAPVGVRIRVGGMVVDDSLARDPQSLAARFAVTDGLAEVVIEYTGILPDLFDEGEAAVATGKLADNGVFMAEEVLAKHDENYTPPEVAEAMEEAHRRAGKTLEKEPRTIPESAPQNADHPRRPAG